MQIVYILLGVYGGVPCIILQENSLEEITTRFLEYEENEPQYEHSYTTVYVKG